MGGFRFAAEPFIVFRSILSQKRNTGDPGQPTQKSLWIRLIRVQISHYVKSTAARPKTR